MFIEALTVHRLRSDEHLAPIASTVAICHIPNSDIGKVAVHDVCFMSGGIHPTIHNGGRCPLALRSAAFASATFASSALYFSAGRPCAARSLLTNAAT